MKKLTGTGIGSILKNSAVSPVPGIIFFLTAGKPEIIGGWVYFSCVLPLNTALAVKPVYGSIGGNRKGETVGPYGIVRHPGYLSHILFFTAFPFIVTSFFAALSMGAGIIIMVMRIRYEDEILERKVNGYREYKKNVKYRLVPFIW
jgi:protein-S-isoprenylcysteine O-methyltransferase Ste14